jgi:hypothetical protein
MDIEMINKFLKVVISAVILAASGYASKASAIFVESELSLTTYEWSATCYDCKDGNLINKRPEDPELWKGVTGSITLSDYTLGDAITSTNFVSFAYTGVSQFLPMFTVGTGEGFDFTTAFVGGALYTNAELTLELLGYNSSPAPREPSYSAIPTLEDLVDDYDADTQGTKWNATMACLRRAPSLPNLPEVLKARKRRNMQECLDNADAAFDEMNDAIEDAEDDIRDLNSYNAVKKIKYEQSMEAHIRAMAVNIAPTEWSFGRNEGESLDIGSAFVVRVLKPIAPPSQVSAPATLAIFALGLMGLASRRFKKQA